LQPKVSIGTVSIGGVRRDYFEDMNRFIEEHRITPVVDRKFTFDEALQAFVHMAEQRHFGKLVINVAGGQASGNAWPGHETHSKQS
jgi:NADPH:quinone reductase-like Zn-dependent oxidoreductase